MLWARSLRRLAPRRRRCSTARITPGVRYADRSNQPACPACALRCLRGGGAGRSGRELSIEAGPDHRDGNPWRTAGPSRPLARRASRPGAGRYCRGGEPARRGWQRRDAGSGAQRTRRLHAGRRGPGPLRAQPAHVRQPGLQRDRGLRADHPDRARCAAARGESAGAGAFGRGADSAREQEAGRVELRLPRYGHAATSGQ